MHIGDEDAEVPDVGRGRGREIGSGMGGGRTGEPAHLALRRGIDESGTTSAGATSTALGGADLEGAAGAER